MTEAASLPTLSYRVRQLVDPDVVCGPCTGGWYQLRPAAGGVTILDADGATIDEWAVSPGALVGRGTRWPVTTVDPTGRRVVRTREDRTDVADAAGGVISIGHTRWARNAGVAAIDPGRPDRLWTVTASRPTGHTQPPSGIVGLVDVASGEVVDAVDLDDGAPEGYSMLTMGDRGLVLNGGYGQDGSMIWFLRVGDGDRIERRTIDDSGVLADADPERGEILILPHDGDHLEIRTWWDGELVTQVDSVALFEELGGVDDEDDDGYDEPDMFDFQGSFLGPDHLVGLTTLERILVLRRDGTAVGWLDDPGTVDLGGFASIGRGRTLARGRHGTAVLELDV